MSPNGTTTPSGVTLPKELEDYAAKLPPAEKNKFWKRVAEEVDRFSVLSPSEQEADIEKADEDLALADYQLKLLQMKPAEMEAELKRREQEAREAKDKAEREWRETVADLSLVILDDDVARRKAEAGSLKKLTAEKTSDLVNNFKKFLAEKDLGGCGAVLYKLALTARTDEILNYYGYQSDISGLHKFFNEVLGAQEPIIGEKALDNFLWQQRAYALEDEISCLAESFNQWSLSFAMGRKDREWYQLDDNEHILAVFWAIKKIKPEIAARKFGRLAYSFEVPREKFKLGAEKDIQISRDGKMILMTFAESFEKQMAKKEFNPEAADILSSNREQLEALGLKQSFFAVLDDYGKIIKDEPDGVETVKNSFSLS